MKKILVWTGAIMVVLVASFAMGYSSTEVSGRTQDGVKVNMCVTSWSIAEDSDIINKYVQRAAWLAITEFAVEKLYKEPNDLRKMIAKGCPCILISAKADIPADVLAKLGKKSRP